MTSKKEKQSKRFLTFLLSLVMLLGLLTPLAATANSALGAYITGVPGRGIEWRDGDAALRRGEGGGARTAIELQPSTTYRVRILAKNELPGAPASPQRSIAAERVGTNKISFQYISASENAQDTGRGGTFDNDRHNISIQSTVWTWYEMTFTTPADMQPIPYSWAWINPTSLIVIEGSHSDFWIAEFIVEEMQGNVAVASIFNNGNILGAASVPVWLSWPGDVFTTACTDYPSVAPVGEEWMFGDAALRRGQGGGARTAITLQPNTTYRVRVLAKNELPGAPASPQRSIAAERTGTNKISFQYISLSENAEDTGRGGNFDNDRHNISIQSTVWAWYEMTFTTPADMQQIPYSWAWINPTSLIVIEGGHSDFWIAEFIVEEMQGGVAVASIFNNGNVLGAASVPVWLSWPADVHTTVCANYPGAPDWAALDAAIAEAQLLVEAHYSPLTWQNMQGYLTAATNMRAMRPAPTRQGVINAAAADLIDAMDNLAFADPDVVRAMLLPLINTALGMDVSGYSVLSRNAFNIALANAEEAYDDVSATADELAAAYRELAAAIAGLRIAVGSANNLVVNGDFTNSNNGWGAPIGALGAGYVHSIDNPNPTGLDYVARLHHGHQRVRSDATVTITQPGIFRLSAWGRTPGVVPDNHGQAIPGSQEYPLRTRSQLFLASILHTGSNHGNHDGHFHPDHPMFGVDDETGLLTGRVVPSVTLFPMNSEWTYQSTVFELTQPVLDLFENQFRVVFAREGGGPGVFYISGITLMEVCHDCTFNPCLCGEVVDRTALYAAIGIAEDRIDGVDYMLYTTATWETLQLALSVARTVYGAAGSTQEAINDAEYALSNATSGLTAQTAAYLIENFLEGVIADALPNVGGNFTAVSYGVFTGALASAQAITQASAPADIAAAYRALVAAIAGLVPGQYTGNLIVNGDFANNRTGWNTYADWMDAWWGNYWIIPNNDNVNANNNSPYMTRLELGWTRVRSAETIVITEPGIYRLSAWGRVTMDPPFDENSTGPGANNNDITTYIEGVGYRRVRAQLFLAYAGHRGTNHDNRNHLFPASNTRVVPSLTLFTDNVWTYEYTVFELTQELLDLYNNEFRVVFVREGGEGTGGVPAGDPGEFYITGITLMKICPDCTYNPCLCDHVVDRTALNTAIEIAEGRIDGVDYMLYTTATWVTLQSTLAAARTVYGATGSTQEAINAAEYALSNATSGLIARTAAYLIENFLEGAIANALPNVGGNFTAASYGVFTVALASAQAITQASSPASIVAAYRALVAAIAGLAPGQNTGNLIVNGDFVNNSAGWNTYAGWMEPWWGSYWIIPNNDNVNVNNNSPYMTRLELGWTRVRSAETIVITEPGIYRLSAWGRVTMDPPFDENTTGPNATNNDNTTYFEGVGYRRVRAQLFLAYAGHRGTNHDNRNHLFPASNTRVVPSLTLFTNDVWTYEYTVFELTQELLDLYNNEFRVVFVREGGEGTPGVPAGDLGEFYITGITLMKVCHDCTFNPCVCHYCEICGEDPCVCIYEPSAVFSLHAFNNGVINNQSLANGGIIRIWTRLDGVNAFIPYAGLTVTAVLPNGECAMQFVNVNRPWNNQNYVNLIDVNMHAPWQRIYLTATLHGSSQVVDLTLVNPRFFSLQAFNNGVINNQSLADSGLIRIWTQLMGVAVPVSNSIVVTAVDQDGVNAMEFVRINEMWYNPGNVNLIDVNFNAPWYRIYLTATVFGQTVELVLVNPRPPVVPEFSLNVFNNGVINNQSLANAGLIRLWTRLDGVNANVLITDITAVDQNGNDAMEHLRRVNTVGVTAQNGFDVNFNAPWQRIYLTVTAYGQTLELVLINPQV